MLELQPIEKLKKDIKLAAVLMDSKEARYLVDSYYQMQDNRIRSSGQIRSMDEEPNQLLSWLDQQNIGLENSIKSALLSYAKSHEVGDWLLGIYGVGPVLAAGFLAHIDIEKANTAAKIWRFAGLDPTIEWKKGEKRPWNAKLKTLCWKFGQSIMKLHNNDKCFYGKLYEEKKADLIKRNEIFEYKDYALGKATKVSKSTEAYKAYKEGKLPPGQIDARARRYAVKIFLAHLQQVWWETHFKKPCALPYAIAHLNHADFIAPPGYTPL
jgi:hypothetical protein